ncbi:MAG: 30S ribosomal protein S9 [Proteobacteria bacterium]|jgi:small subunit ribosomal protein S9|nr:30S ribosomal protein S9 [Pseudomonadota bacterium]
MAAKYIHTVGKRKTAIARIWMKPGKGEITINKRTMDEYYLRATSKMVIMQPLELTGSVGQFDIRVNVIGGGLSGQAGAIRHAISRALANSDLEARKVLKKAGLITRDSRKKERKLPGQPGARKRFQYSKR